MSPPAVSHPIALTAVQRAALQAHAGAVLAVLETPVPSSPPLRRRWLEAARLAVEGHALRILEQAKADGRELLNDDEERAWQTLDGAQITFNAALAAARETDSEEETRMRTITPILDSPVPAEERRADPNPIADDGGPPVTAMAPFGIPPGISIRRAAPRPALSFGGLVRAMTVGPRTPEEKRALAESTDSAGGITVPSILLAEWIDRLRSALVCVRAGAVTVDLLSDSNTMARLTGDPAGTWRLENSPVTEADATFDGVVFAPKSYAVIVRCSREVLADSVNIDQMLGAAFVGGFAVEIDRVALRGSGTAPEPRGILNTTGVGATAVAGNLTWDVLLAAVGALGGANAPAPTAIIMNPANWAKLVATKGTDGHYLAPPPETLPPILTTTGLNNTDAIVGNFAELLFGVRQALRVELLRETYASSYQYAYLAHLRFDVGLAHPAAFHKLTGLTIT